MNIIREARKSRGLSQGELASLIGVTQGAVNQWEHGLTKPRLEKLLPLSNALGISVEDILRAG